MRLARLPCGEMTDSLLNTSLNMKQWVGCHFYFHLIFYVTYNISEFLFLLVSQMQLNKINEVLSEDYQCRRQMMLKRFQVTLESFAWGDKHKVGASVSN